MNLYTTLASTKDELRRAKDHEQTIRAIVESQAEISGKNADARKSELTLVLTQNSLYKKALAELRTAEYNVDEAQADIDQAESERRDREWAIRSRLADALNRQHVESEDAVPDWLADKRAYDAGREQYNHPHVIGQRTLDDLYPTK